MREKQLRIVWLSQNFIEKLIYKCNMFQYFNNFSLWKTLFLHVILSIVSTVDEGYWKLPQFDDCGYNKRFLSFVLLEVGWESQYEEVEDVSALAWRRYLQQHKFTIKEQWEGLKKNYWSCSLQIKENKEERWICDANCVRIRESEYLSILSPIRHWICSNSKFFCHWQQESGCFRAILHDTNTFVFD